MIVTIDGPIATGKSSIAKKLAEKLGFIFFDTGAMYRCLTYALIVNKIDSDNLKALQAFLPSFTFEIKIRKGEKRYIYKEEDVTEKIRGETVTNLVSKVSALKPVREKLIALQRELSSGVNAIFEGRDLGTVVFPHAELKVFLTGRPEVRALRRYEELRARFPKETEKLTVEQTLIDINKRDTLDTTRELSPLRKAEDAFIIDTSDLSVDEIVDKILEFHEGLRANGSHKKQ